MSIKSLLSILFVVLTLSVSAQSRTGIIEGKCSSDIKWEFDGNTLTISKIAVNKYLPLAIPDYDLKQNLAPWIRRKLAIKRVKIGDDIVRIGSCAFANCKELAGVEFESTSLTEIGWGAFLNCSRLRNFSIPVFVQKIETIAFANCSSLLSVKIPNEARVDDQAFLSCTSLSLLEIAPTANIGHYVFATELKDSNGKISHTFYNNEIRRLANNINTTNCEDFGLSRDAVAHLLDFNPVQASSDVVISRVDTLIPETDIMHSETYALIIGNQHYRFASEVAFANHDAYVFSEYCERTLGIPSANIHLCEDATKHIILEEEMEWLQSIESPGDKKLLVYYAGHGVPDTRNGNRSYILPVDVYGTKPSHGIALDDFYASIGELGFSQVSVFIDACFSGVNRDYLAVNKDLKERVVEVDAEQGKIMSDNMVVFSAAQGNETAQAYTEQGHGLFTYYLLEELQRTGGYLNYGTLADAILNNVSRKADALKLRKKQTPTITASDSYNDEWRRLEF